MQELPPEYSSRSLACGDDGTTGASLNAVSTLHTCSTLVRQISTQYRYQSIAVSGSIQIQHLVDTLRSLPVQLPRIRFLFTTIPYFRSPATELQGGCCLGLTLRLGPRRVMPSLRQGLIGDREWPKILGLTRCNLCCSPPPQSKYSLSSVSTVWISTACCRITFLPSSI
ncbi:hypothetical protein DFH09DRAFT_462378 [Mycena vulgaris]|nr:hypothetical protein DFH09DRAFT_462378 [Mycena vulgaris]